MAHPGESWHLAAQSLGDGMYQQALEFLATSKSNGAETMAHKPLSLGSGVVLLGTLEAQADVQSVHRLFGSLFRPRAEDTHRPGLHFAARFR